MSTPTAATRWQAGLTPTALINPTERALTTGEGNLLTEAIEGAVGGLIATLPMTLVMLIIRRVLPWPQRYRLEPQMVTEKAARRLGLGKRLGKPQRQALATVAHLGFGAAAGAAFGPLANRLPLPPMAGGLLYGLTVWAGSYAGWIPALGILNPPDERPKGRNLMMIVAHGFWGAVLGLFVQRQSGRAPRRWS